jgi:hypothetical protein
MNIKNQFKKIKEQFKENVWKTSVARPHEGHFNSTSSGQIYSDEMVTLLCV